MKFLTHIINAHISGTTILFLLGLNSKLDQYIDNFQEAFESRAVRVILAQAPESKVVIYKKVLTNAWYSFVVDDTFLYEDKESLEATRTEIMNFIKEQEIDPNDLILSGFSQGGAMTLYTGCMSPDMYKAVIALNTYLPFHLLTNCKQKQKILMFNTKDDKIFRLGLVKRFINMYRLFYGEINHFISDGGHMIYLDKLIFLIDIITNNLIHNYTPNDTVEIY